jgi:radical SAM superfamily enzyme YgiQ (UPF0313 family)
MNILLLSPRYPDTFWSLKHSLPFIGSKATFPPLGLLTVAAMLPTEWNKKLIDMNTTKLTDKDILQADMVFVGAMFIQKESTLAVIKRCHELGKKVVCGGPLFMSCRDEFDHADYLILGEAEATLPIFLKDMVQGTLQHVYSSSGFPDINKNPPPLPLWSLIRFKDYASMSVQYSRGCPFDCEFCDIVVMNGKVPRAKTPERMIEELEALYGGGWRGRVFIVDDNFIGHKPNAIKTLNLLVEWQKKMKHPFAFACQASIDLADNQELMQKMRASNFYQVFVGIETPSLDSLSECGKQQNIKVDLRQAINTLNANGMQVMAGFIVGFDSDPVDIFNMQIDFIQKSGIVAAMVATLGAPPGTRLWHRLKAENRLLPDYTGDNIIDGKTNIVPLIGIDNLSAGYKKILLEIYSKESYYKRISTFLKYYKPSVVNRIRKNDMGTLLKTFWRIGLLPSGERRLFWKIIIKTLFTNKKALPEVIAYTIYGRHFQAIVKKL